MASTPAPAPHVPQTALDAIPPTVARLRRAFASGRTRPLAWRREQLRALEALARERGRELVAALQADLRKPEIEAWMTDVAVVASDARAARKKLPRWTRPETVRTPLSQRPGRARIVREPLGVVLIIAPWNYPVQLVLQPLVGAIAAGNCAVLKPSEVTAHTSAALAEIVPRYLDPECIAVVKGAVPETTALLEQRFDHIFYTGNASVGRVVLQAAARHLTPVTLELGGKSPALVDESANLEVAARRIAWGKFLNAGQTCVAPDYVLVAERHEKELVDLLARAVRDFYGDDPKATKDFARIVSDRHHARLSSLLRDGEIAFGGDADAGERYLSPTILRHVRPDSAVMSQEIFGPILPVIAVRDVDEAIAFVTAREKPLALYVFTEDETVEARVVAETSSGGVCVNATLWHLANPALPFGGVGESGMGAYHGRASFETFSHRKSVLTKPTKRDPRFAYPPYGRMKTALLRRFL